MTWIFDADMDLVNTDHVRQIIKQPTINGYNIIAIYNSAEETIIGSFDNEQEAQAGVDYYCQQLNGGSNAEDRPT